MEGRGAMLAVETAWVEDLATEMKLTFSETVRGQACIECIPQARCQAEHWSTEHGLYP